MGLKRSITAVSHLRTAELGLVWDRRTEDQLTEAVEATVEATARPCTAARPCMEVVVVAGATVAGWGTEEAACTAEEEVWEAAACTAVVEGV